jgi:hypothetical protein
LPLVASEFGVEFRLLKRQRQSERNGRSQPRAGGMRKRGPSGEKLISHQCNAYYTPAALCLPQSHRDIVQPVPPRTY